MGKYLVKSVRTGYCFSLASSNGKVLGTSEVYTTKAACFTGADSVRRNASLAALEDLTGECAGFKCPRFELYAGRDGLYRFRLRAKNGEIILASGSYTRRSNCRHGVESVRRNADSPVLEA